MDGWGLLKLAAALVLRWWRGHPTGRHGRRAQHRRRRRPGEDQDDDDR